MRGMKIGEIAQAAGVAPSAIRYYEQSGLMPRPRRESRQRRYDSDVLGYLEIIRIARSAGLNIRETHELMTGFASTATPAVRWQLLAARKRQQLDALEARVQAMKAALDSEFRCGCATIEQCARGLANKGRRRGPKTPAG
jgi:MerR family redox-sensitive transcriptional activator SoxR